MTREARDSEKIPRKAGKHLSPEAREMMGQNWKKNKQTNKKTHKLGQKTESETINLDKLGQSTLVEH